MSTRSFFSFITSLLPLFILLLLLDFPSLCAAAHHRQQVLQPTTAASSASALASAHGYSYIGCWNETTGYKSNGGARALVGGRETAHKKMTIPTCLLFCSRPATTTSPSNSGDSPAQYAALTLGRQCLCSSHLSLLSERLDESSRCIFSCDGNASQICGGPDALTLYNLTDVQEGDGEGFKTTGIAWSQFSGAAGYGTLALVTLVIAAVL